MYEHYQSRKRRGRRSSWCCTSSAVMAAGANTFPTRCSSLWPALNDDELMMGTSSSVSSTATSSASSTSLQPRHFLPQTSNAQLYELSAFMTSSTATCGPQTAAGPTFLDDLLQEEGDGHAQNFQLHDDVAVSSAMNDVGVMSDAAFFSLGEEAQRGETTYSSSASGSPMAGTSTTRLLQLETNYERKKKRAKINRKDLNSRFQELMDILHLKEDRKLNRAKILEKTIEHIDKLTEELNALKARQLPQQKTLHQKHERKVAGALHNSHQMMPSVARSIGQKSMANTAQGSTIKGPPLLPYHPHQNHPWSAGATGSSLPLLPMIWLPSPVTTSSEMMLKRTAPGLPADTLIRKRSRVESMESSTTTVSEAVSETENSIETSEVVARDASTSNESSLFEWSAQEIPTLLSFCDAWTLVSLMGTSRELRKVSSRDELWRNLCRVRWRLPLTIIIAQPRQQWLHWHETNHLPDCTAFTRGGVLFSSGRAKGVSVWGLLSHRSNGHTTRTVLLNGKATVMQVVELFIVVQNLTHGSVRVTDSISLASKSSTAGAESHQSPFQPFTAASGAHLMPQVIAFNSEPCATKDLAGITLLQGDLCVLSVFMACRGLELEDQFLQRAGSLDVECEIDTRNDVLQRVNVRAACKNNNDNGRHHEKERSAI